MTPYPLDLRRMDIQATRAASALGSSQVASRGPMGDAGVGQAFWISIYVYRDEDKNESKSSWLS